MSPSYRKQPVDLLSTPTVWFYMMETSVVNRLKCKFVGLLSVGGKIRQITQINFETASPFLFKSAPFFIVMTHNSSVNFKLMHFLLSIKGSYQSPNFEIFQVLWWIFDIFLLSFSKPQTSFFKLCHHSSVSWKITPLDFLGQTKYTLHKRNQSK